MKIICKIQKWTKNDTVVAFKKIFAVGQVAQVMRCKIWHSNTDAKKKALVCSCFDANFRTYHKSSPIS